MGASHSNENNDIKTSPSHSTGSVSVVATVDGAAASARTDNNNNIRNNNSASPTMMDQESFTQADVDAIIANDKRRRLVVVHGIVHDVTSFAPHHPGGASVFADNNGADMTEVFDSTHGARAAQKLKHWAVGPLVPAAAAEANNGGSSSGSGEGVFTAQTLRARLAANPSEILLVFFGEVYDATHFASQHPGGRRILETHNGKECGDAFMRIHGLRAKHSVQQYRIGHMEGTEPSASPLTRFAAAVPTRGPAMMLSATRARAHSTRILSITPHADNPLLRVLTLSSPSPLRCAPGGHIKIYSDVDRDEGKPYSPFLCEIASFNICVKHYPNGRTSGYIFGKREGDELLFDGPHIPSWVLSSDAALTCHNNSVEGCRKHVLLLAGGTGIAPMYSIARDILEKQNANVSLYYATPTRSDILLDSELEELVAMHTGTGERCTLTVRIAMSQGTPRDVERATQVPWAAQVTLGRLDASALAQTAADVAIMTCNNNNNNNGNGLNDIVVSGSSSNNSKAIGMMQSAVICGPPAFNQSMAAAVVQAGLCDAKNVHVL